MRRLVYKSRAKPGITRTEVVALAERAALENTLRSVTGLLLCDGITFCQVLEGEAESVGTLMAKITADPRHSDVMIMSDQAIAERRFSEWSMALVDNLGLLKLLSYVREWTMDGMEDVVQALGEWKPSDSARAVWPAIYCGEQLRAG